MSCPFMVCRFFRFHIFGNNLSSRQPRMGSVQDDPLYNACAVYLRGRDRAGRPVLVIGSGRFCPSDRDLDTAELPPAFLVIGGFQQIFFKRDTNAWYNHGFVTIVTLFVVWAKTLIGGFLRPPPIWRKLCVAQLCRARMCVCNR